MKDDGLAALVYIARMMQKARARGATIRRAVESCGGPAAFYASSERQCAAALGGPSDVAEALSRFLSDGGREEAVRESVRLRELGADATWIDGPGYPVRLLPIPTPPPVLFFRSAMPDPLRLLECEAVAVIGTRRPTAYGREAATRIAKDLALEGVVVVSGLAAGIDACAHAGALEAGGTTVAVMANGIDRVYPRENETLAERIARNGLLLTELPPGMPPKATLFPARNRIISGLCDATAVVEASARSGTMITAGCALDQGRDVFAVPGSIFGERSDGTNQLLKEGAFVLTDAEDILDRLPSGIRFGRHLAGCDRKEKDGMDSRVLAGRVLSTLAEMPLDADGISARLGLGIAATTALLASLELEGRVVARDGRFETNGTVL